MATKRIDIEFEDVLNYIQEDGLYYHEAERVAKAMDNGGICGCVLVDNNTIMAKISIKELQELINKHGVEAIVAQLKQSITA